MKCLMGEPLRLASGGRKPPDSSYCQRLYEESGGLRPPLAKRKHYLKRGLMRALEEVEQAFPDSADNGLSSEAVARSGAAFGANKLTPLPREPLWKKFLEKFDEPIIKILLAAALLSMFVDLFQANLVAALTSLIAVAVAVGVVFLLRQGRWLPTLLFVSAIVLFFVGLGRFIIPRSRGWPSWSPSSWPPASPS